MYNAQYPSTDINLPGKKKGIRSLERKAFEIFTDMNTYVETPEAQDAIEKMFKSEFYLKNRNKTLEEIKLSENLETDRKVFDKIIALYVKRKVGKFHHREKRMIVICFFTGCSSWKEIQKYFVVSEKNLGVSTCICTHPDCTHLTTIMHIKTQIELPIGSTCINSFYPYESILSPPDLSKYIIMEKLRKESPKGPICLGCCVVLYKDDALALGFKTRDDIEICEDCNTRAEVNYNKNPDNCKHIRKCQECNIWIPSVKVEEGEKKCLHHRQYNKCTFLVAENKICDVEVYKEKMCEKHKNKKYCDHQGCETLTSLNEQRCKDHVTCAYHGCSEVVASIYDLYCGIHSPQKINQHAAEQLLKRKINAKNRY